MANIMINQVCNLMCRYCFADETVNQDNCSANDMTFDNFKKAVQISIDSKSPRIGIIGGEPTIHPEFEKFVEYASDTFKGTIVIFSNGIELPKYQNLFLRNNVHCLWNFNGPDISGAMWHRIKESADYLFHELKLQPHFTLGLNLYEPNMDYQFFVNCCKEYKIENARIAITVPNSKSDRGSGYLERIKQMKDLLIHVCEDLVAVGVKPHLDCTMLPPCIITQEDRERVDRFHKAIGMTYKESHFFDTSPCHPVLDIMPDLSITRCFGCSDMGSLQWATDRSRIHTNEWFSLSDAREVFKHTIDDLGYVIPGNPACISCQYRLRGYCRGGCLGYKKYKIQEAYNLLTTHFGGVNPYVK